MFSFILVLLFGLGTADRQLCAQDSLFAYVSNRQNTRLPSDPVPEHKIETAEQLYEALIQARGDQRLPVPKFVMNKGRRYVAWMNPFRTEIGLEEAAYDVCVQLGADSLNAMAALLAHEITHYYEKHNWSRSFVQTNKQLTVSTKIEELDEGLKFEVQADYLGGILAITAGYNTYHVLDQFLRLAYQAYDLPEVVDGYPSLDERVLMSTNTADRLRQLHSVYQTANLLTILEEHELADDYYQFILKDYHSYEVYNNAGVNACRAALQLIKPEAMPFVFPLELDMSSRLDGLNTRFVKDADARIEELLKTAAGRFKNAIELAPEEASAYLNLALVYTLQEEWLDANYHANKALAASRKSGQLKQTADAQIALGIIAALQGEEADARTQFTLALAGNEVLARTNLAALDETPDAQAVARPPAHGVETIEDLMLDAFLEAPDLSVTTDLGGEVYCGKQSLDHSQLFLHYANEGAEYVLFHETAPNYSGKTREGIQLGDRRADIVQAYGDPAKVLELKRGWCLVYPEQKLLFLLNEQKLLQQWIVYATSR